MREMENSRMTVVPKEKARTQKLNNPSLERCRGEAVRHAACSSRAQSREGDLVTGEICQEGQSTLVICLHSASSSAVLD